MSAVILLQEEVPAGSFAAASGFPVKGGFALSNIAGWLRIPFPISPPSKRAWRSFGGFFDLPTLKYQLAEFEARMAEG